MRAGGRGRARAAGDLPRRGARRAELRAAGALRARPGRAAAAAGGRRAVPLERARAVSRRRRSPRPPRSRSRSGWSPPSGASGSGPAPNRWGRSPGSTARTARWPPTCAPLRRPGERGDDRAVCLRRDRHRPRRRASPGPSRHADRDARAAGHRRATACCRPAPSILVGYDRPGGWPRAPRPTGRGAGRGSATGS